MTRRQGLPVATLWGSAEAATCSASVAFRAKRRHMPSVKNRALLKTLRENREDLVASVLTLEKAVVSLREIAEQNDPMPQLTVKMMVGELETVRRLAIKVRDRDMELSEILADIGMPIEEVAETS